MIVTSRLSTVLTSVSIHSHCMLEGYIKCAMVMRPNLVFVQAPPEPPIAKSINLKRKFHIGRLRKYYYNLSLESTTLCKILD